MYNKRSYIGILVGFFLFFFGLAFFQPKEALAQYCPLEGQACATTYGPNYCCAGDPKGPVCNEEIKWAYTTSPVGDCECYVTSFETNTIPHNACSLGCECNPDCCAPPEPPPPSEWCGDGICNNGEDSSWCSDCTPPPTCSNLTEDRNECCGAGLSKYVKKYEWSDGSGVCQWDIGPCNQPDGACNPPSGGSCDQGCGGVCGYRRSDGTCTTDNSCCHRTCSGSSCVTVVGGGANSCDSDANCTSSSTAKYRCSGSSCIRDDAGGTYTSSNCDNACTSPARYKCSGSSCVRDDAGGTFTSSNCNNTCTPPPPPTISTTLSCLPANGYNKNGFNISWGNPGISVVDISGPFDPSTYTCSDSSFGSWFWKAVSGTSTTAPDGFSNGSTSLTFDANKRYCVRLFNGSTHSAAATITTPALCPACPEGLGACGDAGPNPSSIGTCNGTWINAGNPNYNTWCDYKTNSSRGICYSCNAAIVTPWIQVTGNVHSNTGIDAPEGP